MQHVEIFVFASARRWLDGGPGLLVLAKKSCGRRPRRPHLYKERKGGPATNNKSGSDRGEIVTAGAGNRGTITLVPVQSPRYGDAGRSHGDSTRWSGEPEFMANR